MKWISSLRQHELTVAREDANGGDSGRGCQEHWATHRSEPGVPVQAAAHPLQAQHGAAALGQVDFVFTFIKSRSPLFSGTVPRHENLVEARILDEAKTAVQVSSPHNKVFCKFDHLQAYERAAETHVADDDESIPARLFRHIAKERHQALEKDLHDGAEVRTLRMKSVMCLKFPISLADVPKGEHSRPPASDMCVSCGICQY